VDVLKVSHVIVCGHKNCGGVNAALTDTRVGIVDNWLRNIKDVRDKHSHVLKALKSEKLQSDLLSELNVLEQVGHLARTTVVEDAWARGQKLTLHGWCYGLSDGRIRDIGVKGGSLAELDENFSSALSDLTNKQFLRVDQE
jgi:carbonic anhydrase